MKVLAHGAFDLLHLGHIRYLEAAKRLGDELIVSVTSDRFASKAPGRPVYPLSDRISMLKALQCVDRVVVSDAPTAVEVIREIRPDIYCKGIEYAGGKDRIAEEVEAVEAIGGRVEFIDTPTMSSSSILNRHVESPEVAEYLDRARSLDYARKIPELLEKIKDLRVLFVGETIIDEYVYISALSKPSKEFILACKEESREIFDGGVMASIRHAKSFVHECLVTSPRIVRKTRYVDPAFTRKLFEVYNGDLSPIEKEFEEAAISVIRGCAPSVDLIVVNDFGHGMMTPRVKDCLREHAPWLALNAQSNAGNHGFNLVTAYEHADYICLDAPEIRLALSDRQGDLGVMAASLAEHLDCRKIAVTQGHLGCLMYDGETHHIPAFSTKIVDTMGSGDAFLAVTAPLAKVSDDLELIGFIGNIVGAIKVSSIGHRKPVDKETVLRYAQTLLK